MTARDPARKMAAPMSASRQLLTYQHVAIAAGTPPLSSTAKCGGTTAASRIHQMRVGESINAARSSAFVGQSTAPASAWNVRASPSLVPMK